MSHNSPFDDQIERNPSAAASDTASSSQPAPDRTIPRCGQCGYDRSHLSAQEPCPDCGKPQGAPRCTFCGYELVGLQVTQSCPECGKPIWDSNVQPPTSGLSIASMVLGIVSLMSCIFYGIPALILGPLAIIFGEISIRQYKIGTRAGNTKGFSLTGRICGWAGLAVGGTFLGLVLWVVTHP